MASSFRFNVKFPEFAPILTRYASRAKNEALANLEHVVANVADQIGGVAQSLVPQDSGELAASGHIRGPFRSGNSVAAAYGFDAPYAAAEHEGFHGGRRIKGEPPRFLFKATKAQDKGAFQMQVYGALYAALNK